MLKVIEDLEECSFSEAMRVKTGVSPRQKREEKWGHCSSKEVCSEGKEINGRVASKGQ